MPRAYGRSSAISSGGRRRIHSSTAARSQIRPIDSFATGSGKSGRNAS